MRGPVTHVFREGLLGALGLGLLLAGAPASAQDFDLTLAMLPSPHTAYGAMIATIPDRIAKATDGRVKITLNDSLIGGPQIAPAVRDGRVRCRRRCTPISRPRSRAWASSTCPA